MKLKPIAATMVVLGLAAPAFTANAAVAGNTQAQLDAMKAQISKMEAIINQNSSGGYQNPNCWWNRITLSGMINVDGSWSNTSANFGINNGTSGSIPTTKGYTTNLALNNANLFVDAVVNDWTKAHIALAAYNNLHSAFTRSFPQGSVNSSGDFSPKSDALYLDEAYVTIGNFCNSPIYFRAGKEYVPFGVYQRYPIIQNPTQLLSETSATVAQLGFVLAQGFYGSAYIFRGLPSVTKNSSGTVTSNNRPRVANYGANVGFTQGDQDWSYKLDAGYIRNLADVNFVSQGLAGYIDQVGGLALSADGRYQQFDGGLRYVAALTKFNQADYQTASGSGAKPTAFGAEVGFSFPVVNNRMSRVNAGYQHTTDSSSLAISNITTTNAVGYFGLPLNRYYVGYGVNVSKWTDVGVVLYRDQDYGKGQGGTAGYANAAVARLSVKFA